MSIIVVLMLSISIFHSDISKSFTLASENFTYDEIEYPELASSSNNEIINSIFDARVSDYSDLGYFPQIYEPSIQATYYALFIFDAIGKLNHINQSEIINYIMSQYDGSSNRFMDTLAYRYLDTDFSKTYFPLNSILEVNCYAILSLNILNRTDLFNTQGMIDFIWDCYNPETSGFIGQPYSAELEEGFRVSTADNTFFAVFTLNLLMDNWVGYSSKIQDIIQYINNLQYPGGLGWMGGGFRNDDNTFVDTLNPFFEPNLISSYYCIKALEIFGMEESINIVDFHQFLDYLYDSNSNYFRISEWDYGVNYTNVVATALGLELSDITSYGNIDRDDAIAFIMGNRNSFGNWDESTIVKIHELIDTFQIIRSLRNSNETSQFSLEAKNQIGNSTLSYSSYEVYSLLSDDYTSMSYLHTIISSFSLFDRISDLEIQELYTRIKNSYIDFADFGISRYFYGYLLDETEILWFRSHPIEYYTSGHKNYLKDISQLNSHKSTYFALESLQKLFKLDDFATEFDLMSLVNDIVDTQFLNDTYYENYGGFSPILKYDVDRSEYLNTMIYCEYTYYALRCLEILSNYLTLNITDLGFDITALYTYLNRNTIENTETLYFNPSYTSDVETILQNTYYMIYIMKMLNLYDKNTEKIENYVENNLNYNNIKNIYYSYKISEILGLDISFDISLTQDLIQSIYSEEREEFYLTPDKIKIELDTFLWISEMARNSQIGINAQYCSQVPLGGVNHMEVSLSNLIVRDFGSYISFKFESDQIGTINFNKLENNIYVADVPIPMNSENYPTVAGVLYAYEGAQVKAEYNVIFNTIYSLAYNLNISKTASKVKFEVNGSILANEKEYALINGSVYTVIYKDDIIIATQNFGHINLNESSIFILEYIPIENGSYYFEIYLEDGFQESEVEIGNTLFIKNVDDPHDPDDPDDPDDPINSNQNYEESIKTAIPLMIAFVGVPGCVIAISSKQLGKVKKRPEYNNSK